MTGVYNAQAAVAAGSLLVVETDVSQASNDKQQLTPMLDKLDALPEALGETEVLLADAGYFSKDNVEACEKAGIELLIAPGRQSHHPSLDERFAPAPEAPENPTPVDAMIHRLKTPEGRTLYASRKHTPPPATPLGSAERSLLQASPEPVFGIIKSVIGFRCVAWTARAVSGGSSPWSGTSSGCSI